MANKMAKYRVDCDEPGLQLTGSGGIFGGQSVVRPGTILTVSTDFEPRACMTPLNKPAEDAFARKRLKVAADWRKSLAEGTNPDGQPLEALSDGKALSKEEIEGWVKRMVARVGPTRKIAQRDVKKARPKIDPSTFRASPPEPVKPALEDDDDMLPPDAAGPGQRASDQP